MTANFGLLILPVIFLIAPMVLTVASKQSAGIKQILRYILQASYSSIILLGFFNWETQTAGGRNAYMLALDFQNNFLFGFFVLTLALIAILQFRKYEFDVITAIGNALATALFFTATITISNALGKSIVSPAVITCALIVLINNVLGLALINRNANLLEKYPLSQASVAYAKKHNIKPTKIQMLSTWILLGLIIIFIGIVIWRSLNR